MRSIGKTQGGVRRCRASSGKQVNFPVGETGTWSFPEHSARRHIGAERDSFLLMNWTRSPAHPRPDFLEAATKASSKDEAGLPSPTEWIVDGWAISVTL